jgi:hypothetical protein
MADETRTAARPLRALVLVVTAALLACGACGAAEDDGEDRSLPAQLDGEAPLGTLDAAG